MGDTGRVPPREAILSIMVLLTPLITVVITYHLVAMARVSVKLFATMREAAGVSECQVDAADILELVQRLRSLFGVAFSRELGDTSKDTDRIVILVNGRNIGGPGFGNPGLRDGDEVSIFPPVSGG